MSFGLSQEDNVEVLGNNAPVVHPVFPYRTAPPTWIIKVVKAANHKDILKVSANNMQHHDLYVVRETGWEVKVSRKFTRQYFYIMSVSQVRNSTGEFKVILQLGGSIDSVLLK